MSFIGTEHYRSRTRGVRCGFARLVEELCDHIDEQDKKIEQLKIHLDTYAEVIGKRQQENAELQAESDRLKSQLKAHLESKMVNVARTNPLNEEESKERPAVYCSTCGWFLCATVSEVLEWMKDNDIAGCERGPDWRAGEKSVAREYNRLRRGRVSLKKAKPREEEGAAEL